jgi:2-polyprenyl-3-methyl-5-hydroxy-6-metoxy-1,4-benzoquinol methylase
MKDSCNLCDSNTFELVKNELRDDKLKYKVFSCSKCGHIQLLPKPHEEEDREFYNNNQQDKNRQKEIDYEKLRTNNLFDTNRHVRLIKELSPDVNCAILDIGSGYGFFLSELYKHGYKHVTGIEISAERRSIALRHSSLNFMDYDINNPGGDIGQFDIVTLFHVLEHMADPVAFLRNIRRLMNPKGVIICEVPNVREMLLDNCREYNDFYWIRAHVNYFSDKTLSDCLNKAGYEDVEIRFEQRYGLVNLSNWLAHGEPQIENPIFEIVEPYKSVEAYYKQWLEIQRKSDAMLAIVRNR